MRVLVTGLGLLGTQIVRTLASRGYEVVAYDIRPRDIDILRGVWSDRVRFVQGDITNAEQLSTVAREANVDRIVHTAVLMNTRASLANPVLSFRINVEGTLNVLEVVRERGIRAVCMSSQAVYGPRSTIDVIPPDDIRPWLGSLYASEKAIDEILIDSYHKSYGCDVAVFRPNQMYAPAPTQIRTVMDQMLVKVFRGEPVVSPTGADCVLGWTYAPDMAEAITRALERPTLTNRIFNVEEGVLRSVGEIGQIIKALVPEAVIEIGPGTTMPGYSIPGRRGPGDTQALRQELELVPTTLADGIRACVEWAQKNRETLLATPPA